MKAVLDAMNIMEGRGASIKTFQDILDYGKTMLFTSFFFFENFNLFIATTHTDNTTLHDYLSCATITTLHYPAKPTYRNCTYIAFILLN